jgi:hypothetical protein
MKLKETMTFKTLKARMIMNDKKNAIKKTSWDALWILDERKITFAEKKAMMKLIANENRTIMKIAFEEKKTMMELQRE